MMPELEGQTVQPGFWKHYNVNPKIVSENKVDEDHNPTGGSVRGVGLQIDWQDGPRGQAGTDELLPPNGAFIEDIIYAAIQRLEFFNNSKFRCRENSMAITHLESALQVLKHRQVERSYRNVEGKHEV